MRAGDRNRRVRYLSTVTWCWRRCFLLGGRSPTFDWSKEWGPQEPFIHHHHPRHAPLHSRDHFALMIQDLSGSQLDNKHPLRVGYRVGHRVMAQGVNPAPAKQSLSLHQPAQMAGSHPSMWQVAEHQHDAHQQPRSYQPEKRPSGACSKPGPSQAGQAFGR
jgi:hypothetical protein